MPIYEFQCQDCGHKLERLLKLSDALPTDCPACSKPSLTKLVSAAAFRLKGSGWYETDFKNSGKKPVASEGSAEGSSGDGASSAGTSGDSGSGSNGGNDSSDKGSSGDSQSGSDSSSGGSEKQGSTSPASASAGSRHKAGSSDASAASP